MSVEKIERIYSVKIEGAESVDELKNSMEGANDAAEKQTSSLKELKNQIAELRDKLVGLQNGSDDYKAVVGELVEKQIKLKEVMAAGKNEVEAAEGSYNNLAQRMAALKQVWKETADEATRNEIGAQINELNNQLKAMDASTGNFQRNVGNYKSAVEGLTSDYANQRAELKALKDQLEQLDPASAEYAETMKRAAEITHNLSDQQEQIKLSSADLGDQLSNIHGIATNMVAGFSAVNAAMGLFGEENEEIEQAMLKVQQAMQLVQGMQGIDGFIKGTEGLSKSLGLVAKKEKEVAVNTKASATASKMDSTAKLQETTATEGAEMAQHGLNAAMKANPIGFILGLLATLVTVFSLLKDKIMELIGGNEKMSKTFDKIKVVVAGVGNVIKKSLVNPIKMAIAVTKTLGKVLYDVFTGNWDQIAADVKAGTDEMTEIVKDSINVVAAYKEGADAKQAKLDEEARKKEAEARKKELDNYIKDMEAKEGSNWKFTEEGKKAYDEFFKHQLELYDKDTDEYAQALRDKWAYDREYNENKQKEEDENNKKQKEKSKKAAEERKKEEEKALADLKKKFENYTSLDYVFAKTLNEYEELLNKKIKDSKGKDIFALDLYLDNLKKDLEKMGQYTAEQIDNIINETRDRIQNNALGDTIGEALKGYVTNAENDFYRLDKTYETVINDIELMFDKKKFETGIIIPEDEVKHFEGLVAVEKKIIDKKLETINDQIESFREVIKTTLSSFYGEEENDFTDDVIRTYVPVFGKLLDMQKNLNYEKERLDQDLKEKQSEIYKKGYDNDLKELENYYEEKKSILENYYEWENTERENNAAKSFGFNPENEFQAIKDQKAYLEEYYDFVIELYQKQKDKYIEMSNDMRLTAEERKNAEIEANNLVADIAQANHDKAVALAKNETDKYKALADAIKQSVGSISDTMSSLADSWNSLIELEKTEIAQQLENGEISKEEAEKREAENKKSFENMKKLQIAQAIINSLAAAVSAFQSMASIPYVGPVLGAAAAAAALAAGYANVRQIQATSYDGGSSAGGGSSYSSSNTSFQLPDVMELEPSLGRNLTGMSDTDGLNNGGNGKGNVVKAYVVESDISASQKLANKRSDEITF